MKIIVCTVCPKGCEMLVDFDAKDNFYEVTGNGCKRGKEFVVNEIQHPMRTLQSTVKTSFRELPMVPVRTDGVIPKEIIFDVMKELSKVNLEREVKSGEIIVENILGTGVNIISTIDMQLYL